MMAKDTFLNRKVTLNSRGTLIDLSTPSVMAILNVTPDSFYKNSRVANVDEALKNVETFLAQGAKFIDIGAYSSRPGATDISPEEESNRLLPIVREVARAFPSALISIDTFRASVAETAIEAGAHIINDISGGEMDERMFDAVSRLNVPYIMMHMKGTPQTMQQHTQYQHLTSEVATYFLERIDKLKSKGVTDIILDPGFGFAKDIPQNYTLLQQLEGLQIFGYPILVGFSRKSMINKVLSISAQEALNGTSVLHTAALLKGASILRAHDVKEAVECIKLVEKIKNPYL